MDRRMSRLTRKMRVLVNRSRSALPCCTIWRRIMKKANDVPSGTIQRTKKYAHTGLPVVRVKVATQVQRSVLKAVRMTLFQRGVMSHLTLYSANQRSGVNARKVSIAINRVAGSHISRIRSLLDKDRASLRDGGCD